MSAHRVPLVLLCGLACAVSGFAQLAAAEAAESDDHAFAGIPFEQWLSEGDSGRFHWTARVSSGDLSVHQRLKVKIELQVDGNDLIGRRGHGFLVMLVQIEDGDHRVYRSHGALNLAQVTAGVSKSDIVYSQDVFVRPGEYLASLALFDSETEEHSALQRKFHVNPLKSDPLPAAWNDLPAVEFPGSVDAPDVLFLPNITGRLRLPVENKRPVQIEVLMNASATAIGPGARNGQANNRSLADLLPALKVISQLTLRNGTLNASVLDLTRRRIVFAQDGAGEVDWPRLRAGLVEIDPNKIDVQSLEHREENAQFFVQQVRERMGIAKTTRAEGGPMRIGIVLTGPMSFENGENLHPIEAAGGPDRKLFYIRYHSLPPQQFNPTVLDSLRGGRRGLPPGAPARTIQLEPFDSMLNLVKPLQPRVFDVYTPEQFRRALSALLEEIAKM